MKRYISILALLFNLMAILGSGEAFSDCSGGTSDGCEPYYRYVADFGTCYPCQFKRQQK